MFHPLQYTCNASRRHTYVPPTARHWDICLPTAAFLPAVVLPLPPGARTRTRTAAYGTRARTARLRRAVAVPLFLPPLTHRLLPTTAASPPYRLSMVLLSLPAMPADTATLQPRCFPTYIPHLPPPPHPTPPACLLTCCHLACMAAATRTLPTTPSRTHCQRRATPRGPLPPHLPCNSSGQAVDATWRQTCSLSTTPLHTAQKHLCAAGGRPAPISPGTSPRGLIPPAYLWGMGVKAPTWRAPPRDIYFLSTRFLYLHTFAIFNCRCRAPPAHCLRPCHLAHPRLLPYLLPSPGHFRMPFLHTAVCRRVGTRLSLPDAPCLFDANATRAPLYANRSFHLYPLAIGSSPNGPFFASIGQNDGARTIPGRR